ASRPQLQRQESQFGDEQKTGPEDGRQQVGPGRPGHKADPVLEPDGAHRPRQEWGAAREKTGREESGREAGHQGERRRRTAQGQGRKRGQDARPGQRRGRDGQASLRRARRRYSRTSSKAAWLGVPGRQVARGTPAAWYV